MAIAFVRNLGLSSHSNVGSTASKSFSALPAVGNLITVRVTGWHTSGYTATVPTDNQGNTYTQRATRDNQGAPGRTRVYLYDTVVATSSGTFTITLNNVQSSGNYINWTAVEHSGIATSSQFDVAATQLEAGSSTSTTCTTATTAQADELVVAVIGTAHNSTNDGIADPPTTGYTSRSVYQNSATIIGHESADKIVSATGTQSATWTYNTAPSTGACSAVATYKQAAANDIDGDLSVTQDAQTLSAEGTVAIEGVAEVTQAAQTLSAEGTADQPASEVTTPYPGPAGRKRRRMVVEVDGKVHQVASVEHAERLLAKVVAKVERQVKARSHAPLPKVEIRELDTVLERYVSLPKNDYSERMVRLQAQLDQMYAEWQENDDDEEAVITLLFG